MRPGRALLLGLALGSLGCRTAPPSLPVAPSEVVSGASAAYSLLPTRAGWSRLERDDSATQDLTLRHETGVTVVVHVHRSQNASIDSVVAARRLVLGAEYEFVRIEEERSFSAQPGFVPLSVAEYRVRTPTSGGWFPIRVGTGSREDVIVELIAIGLESPTYTALFQDLLSGLWLGDRPVPRGP